MMYRKVGDAWAVFASKAGADNNPDWYHNLLANPQAQLLRRPCVPDSVASQPCTFGAGGPS